MNSRQTSPRRIAHLLVGLTLAGTPAAAQEHTYSTNADFDLGTLAQVNHDEVPDQLQLDSWQLEFPFLWVVKTGRKSVVRIDANSGQILGEYRTAPDFRAGSPSRTAVDAAGNVWVGNGNEGGGGRGSVVKVGLVIGGSRGHKNADGSFSVDPNGAYLAPPFLYSTAVDRDGDGLIRTSTGLGDVLAWPDLGDGEGGDTAQVADAEDECILIYQRTTATAVLHVSLAADGRVWVGGFQDGPTGFDVLDPATGRIESSMLPSCGGYAGTIDAAGVLWSASYNQSTVLRYDPVSGATSCIPVPWAAAVAVDADGAAWCSTWDRNSIVKLTPAGAMVAGFPKLTGGRNAYGVAVTPDGDIWVANKGTNDISRLDRDGNLRKRLSVGTAPTGVAVDAHGKVWVVNQFSHDVRRLDPQGGADNLGAVDLTVALGTGASPIASGAMTALVRVREVAPSGTWTVKIEGERDALEWESVAWNSREPGESRIDLEVRAAEEEAALASRAWVAVANGERLDGVFGRWLELRASFQADLQTRLSPILLDVAVTVRAQDEEPADCSTVAASTQLLWPPDGRMVAVELGGGDGTTCRITQIMQDEPVGAGSGRAGADAGGMGTSTAYLRAERDGGGNGRVYTIVYVASDAQGGECEGQVTVCVPHDMGAGRDCTNDGMLFDSTIEASLDAENFPNPFNPSTTIRYTVPANGPVRLVVYDAMGRRVRTLVAAVAPAGTHAVTWDGRDQAGRGVPSGVYVYHVQAGDHSVARRMLLLK